MILFFLTFGLIRAKTGAKHRCEDYEIFDGVDYGFHEKYSSIRRLRVWNSTIPAEAEEKCRLLTNCVGYVCNRKKRLCVLKRKKIDSNNTAKDSNFISGFINFEKHRGDSIEINYCRNFQKHQRCASREPDCKQKIDDCKFGFKTDADGCVLPTCECRTSEIIGTVAFGDIVVDQLLIDKISGNASGPDPQLWNNFQSYDRYQIPYELPRALPKSHKALKVALQRIEENSCLTFIKRTNESDYLSFFEGDGCFSSVGRLGGEQKISLGKGCGMYPITVTRQIFHALGFWNEEMRADRDPKNNAYVINQHIAPHLQFNLNAKFINWNDHGEPYDVKSIMHSSGLSYSFNDKPTIIDRNTRKPLALNMAASDTDYAKLNNLYKCSAIEGLKPTTTTPVVTTTASTTMSPCVDSNDNCAAWATMGYCQTVWVEFMTQNCKKSCNICAKPTGISSKPCFDKERHCKWWSSQNFCTDQKYQEYMTQNCAKSCNKC